MREGVRYKQLLLLIFVFSGSVLLSNNKTDSLLLNYNTLSNDTSKIITLQKLFSEYYKQEDYINSILYANKCIDLCKASTPTLDTTLAEAYSLIGKSYYSMSLLSKSLDFHTLSIIKYKKLNLKKEIALENLLIGSIYKQFGKQELAKKNLDEALKLALNVSDWVLVSSIYNNFGNLYAYTHNWDSAISYYHKSLELRISKDGKGYFAPYMNISRSYANINKLDSARKYLVIASRFINDDTYFKSAYLYNYASINVLEKDFVSAENNLNQALAFSEDKNLNSVSILVYGLLSKIYKKQHKYKEALEYHLKYSNLNDSINANNADAIISKVELLFESEKNAIVIEKLNAQNEAERTKNKALAIVLGLIILIAIIFFIQKYYLRKAYVKIVEENVKFLDLKKTNQDLKEEIKTIAESPNAITTEKYKDSSLTDEYKSELANKIINALEVDKIFTKLDLKVSDLADYLDVNRTYISQVLTEEIKVSFIELINSYRIEESKYLLSDEKYSMLTISAIAEMSGFTPSTFNRVFKNQTGVTPSFFMKNSKKSLKK